MAPACAEQYDLRDNAVLHSQKGQTLMVLERYGEAAEEFKLALSLNPYSSLSASLFNNLGVCYRETGSAPLALASFQRAQAIQPGFALYYENLIATYERAGLLSRAQSVFSGVVARNPADAQAWFLLGLIHDRNANKAGAYEAFSKFLELEPHSSLADAARSRL